ncbi:MAG TPA: 3-phosphoshikimate 1-carboxyvinyltransferase [Anaerolineae bacterium]|nr:3-phosphoshikimate 1-carboxyvinyltransferase [Anaerolineae bacterium]
MTTTKSQDLLVYPQKGPLRGTVTVPSDKSISHRAVMFAAIAEGTSYIRNWLPAGDTLATLAAVRGLGVTIRVTREEAQEWDLEIEGRGLRGLRAPEGALDCRNAGTCMRLLAGLLAGQSFGTVLDGSAQLRARPMGRIIGPLAGMGAGITAVDNRAPLTIAPATLRGTRYEMPVASAQVKSALLLAGLYADGPTQVYEPGPARDHTERMLTAMGVTIRNEAGWITLDPPTEPLKPLDMTVPGDISSAAFPLVAALIVPHSDIVIEGVGLNQTRTGILDMVKGMGANIEISNQHQSGGEEVGDLRVRFDELHSTAVAGATVVRGIDEFPIWAVAATQAADSSHVREAHELRVKEVDRITMLAQELRKLGADIDEVEDGFTVNGPVRLYSNEVDSHGDHRLGMAMAVAGLATFGHTRICDAGCIADSFPGFVETMTKLGAEFKWLADDV